jgi:hypothetical protein
MQGNDGVNVHAWQECGLGDGLWEIHAYEIESRTWYSKSWLAYLIRIKPYDSSHNVPGNSCK